MSSPDPFPNPFPGLRSFQSDEKHLFFGREDQVGELLSRLRQSRFLAVVGPSGSGKSSLVRAGLLPELHGGTMTSAGTHWEVLVMRPGGDPLTNLARAMVQADLYDPDQPGVIDQVRTTLDRSALGLVEAVRQSEVPKETNTLLVVDQFEEIFRFRDQGGQSLEEAAAFVKLLMEGSASGAARIYVVITMRSDYLGECAQFHGLAEAVNRGEYLIPRLSRAQRRSAIEGPVQVGGAQISKRLLTKLLNDVGDDPDQLPVLQHALMRTWDYWAQDHGEGEPVDLRHYAATGGMHEALSRHADEVYESLGEARRKELAERVFRSLTERVDETRGIRRPLRLGRLADVVDAPVEHVTEIVDAYRRHGCTFLMPPESVELKERTVIDISHESLMRVWKRLRHWVDEEAQSAGIYRRLEETAQLHRQGRAGLYHDPDLGIALAWRDENCPNQAWAGLYGGDFKGAMEFLEQSQEEAQRQERQREAARQRELQQARELAASQARTARLLRRFIATIGVALLVALGLAAWALRESRIAEQATIEARNEQGKTWLANAQALSSDRDYFGAKLKAARAVGFEEVGRQWASEPFKQQYRVLMQPDLPERDEVYRILQGLPDHLPVWRSGVMPQAADQINDLAVSPVAELAVTAFEDDGALILWDTRSGERLQRVELDQLDAEGLAFNRAGTRLASVVDRTFILWEVGPREIKMLTTKELELGEAMTQVDIEFRSVAFHPAGGIVAMGTDEGFVWLHDLAAGTWQQSSQAFHEGLRINDIEFSPDGALLATAGWDGTVQLIETAGLRPIARLRVDASQMHPRDGQGRQHQALALSFSPDGSRLVMAGSRMPPTLWDVAERRQVATLLEEEFNLIVRNDNGRFRTGNLTFIAHCTAFSADGSRLAIGWYRSVDAGRAIPPTVSLFEVGNSSRDVPRPLHDLTGHATPPLRVAFTPEGDRLVTADEGGRALLWDARRGMLAGGQSPAHLGGIHSLAVSRDERLLASGDETGLIHLWDLTSGRHVAALNHHTGRIADLQFSRDGSWLYSVGYNDELLCIWDVATGERLQTLPHGYILTGVAERPDGTGLMVGGGRTQALQYDFAGDLQPRRFPLDHSVSQVRWLPDGRRFLGFYGSRSNNDYRLCLYEWQVDGSVLRLDETPQNAHQNFIREFDVALGGDRVVSLDNDGVLRFWQVTPQGRLAALNQVSIALPRESIAHVDLDDAGQRMVTSTESGRVQLWTLGNGQLLASIQHPDRSPVVRFGPGQNTLLVGGERGILQWYSFSGHDQLLTSVEGIPGSSETWWMQGPGQTRFLPGRGEFLVAAGSPSLPSAIARWDLQGNEVRLVDHLVGHQAIPRVLALQSQGRLLASGSSEESGELVLWDMEAGGIPLVRTNLASGVLGLDFHPDQRTLVVVLEDRISIWDVTQGLTEAGTLPVTHQRSKEALFSPDGKTLVSGCAGSSDAVGVWSFDPATRGVELRQQLITRQGSIMGVDISPDGRLLSACTTAGHVYLWDLATLKQIGKTLMLGAWARRVGFSPDGNLLAAGGGNGRLVIWSTDGRGTMLADLSEENAGSAQFVQSVAFTEDSGVLVATRQNERMDIYEIDSTIRKRDLTLYVDQVNLENASGGIEWNLTASSLALPPAPTIFTSVGKEFFPFLKENMSPRQKLETLFSHHLEEGDLPAAEAALLAMKNPPAGAEEWSAMVNAILEAYNQHLLRGDPIRIARLESRLERIPSGAEILPESKVYLALLRAQWDEARQRLPEALAAMEPGDRIDFLDALIGQVNSRVHFLLANPSQQQAPALVPDSIWLAAAALKQLAENALESWKTGFNRRSPLALLEESPAMKLAYDTHSGTARVLVEKGASWKYWPEDVAPPKGWNELDFPDARWPSGPADLGFARPQDSDMESIRTLIPQYPGRMAYYFRHAFNLDSLPEVPRGWALSLQRDDGVVIYLNGVEIHREKMPPGKIDDETEALRPVVGGEDEVTFFDAMLDPIRAGNALRQGSNLLAVEVHQVSQNSSDLHLDLELKLVPGRLSTPENLQAALALFGKLDLGANIPPWLAALRETPNQPANSVAPEVWYARSRIASLLNNKAEELRCLETAAELVAGSTDPFVQTAHFGLLRLLRERYREAGEEAKAEAIEAQLEARHETRASTSP